MKIVETVADLNELCAPWRTHGETIGFVPTMGNLHQGHLNLVEAAKQQTNHVVASIFVNPMQFGPNEDLDSYPRTFQDDCEKLKGLGVDILFAPTPSIIYPNGTQDHTFIKVPHFSDGQCGASRPVFFQGICTVVAKLFNMVQPTHSFFGEKDIQQLTIIKRMVMDLGFPIEIIGIPIARETDGLAMSSRNQYLSQENRQKATCLYQLLQETRDKILNGDVDFKGLSQSALTRLKESGFNEDYFDILNPATFNPATPEDTDIVIMGAAYLGKTRLIDNIIFKRN